jgi:hypothetical protein
LIHALGYDVDIPKKITRRRRSRYEPIVEPLMNLWAVANFLCGKRLAPFLPELLSALKRHEEIQVTEEQESLLLCVSAATIDRLLGPWRRAGSHRRFSLTKPGTLLKDAIPIKTFAEWEDSRPGFLEVDLVHHCGESVDGFYLTTLSAVDVATGWSECVAVWGKGQERVGAAIHRTRQRLPFPLLGLDSDNGSEFINRHLFTYCQKERITFTRSRSYKKNLVIKDCSRFAKNQANRLIRRTAGEIPDGKAYQGKKITAKTYNSGFALGHDSYNAMGTGSDGKIYYVLSSDNIDQGGAPFTDDLKVIVTAPP